MRRGKKAKAGKGIITLVLVVLLMMPVAAMSGNLEPSGPPDNGTMHTLDEIYEKCVPAPCEGAPVGKTGQTLSYGTGDDGDHEAGVASPSPRFTDNSNGTGTDNLTGLIWLKNASCFGERTWTQALSDCNGLANGSCGLTDGSQAGDWRLPNLFELESLRDMSNHNPVLPSGHPFTGVRSSYYWSGTSYASSTGDAWLVYMDDGRVYLNDKAHNDYVWPVRGGND